MHAQRNTHGQCEECEQHAGGERDGAATDTRQQGDAKAGFRNRGKPCDSRDKRGWYERIHLGCVIVEMSHVSPRDTPAAGLSPESEAIGDGRKESGGQAYAQEPGENLLPFERMLHL
jgi:hypothetical protein